MLALLLQSAGQMVILINFKINQAYIARVLCENKDKPEMKCNGKCHLNKKLKEQETKEQNLPPQIKLKEQNLYFEQMKQTGLINLSESFSCLKFYLTPSIHHGFESLVFQPPNS
jgi:hypothetical protein